MLPNSAVRPDEQLQRTVTRRRWRGVSALSHCALALRQSCSARPLNCGVGHDKDGKKHDLRQALSRFRALILAGAAIVAGCATPGGAPDQEMSALNKTTIRTVHIDRNVVLPQMPRVRTRADTWAEGYGGLIAVIRSTDESKEQATVEYLKKNDIQIGKMLVDAFATEFEARNQFSVVKSPIGADAVIII